MSVSHRGPEAEFAIAVHHELYDFARSLNPNLGEVVGELQGVSHTETDAPQTRKYAFNGFAREFCRLNRVPGSSTRQVITQNLSTVWLNVEWRTDYEAKEFSDTYRERVSEPDLLGAYKAFAVISTWRYIAPEMRGDVLRREAATQVWGFLSGEPTGLLVTLGHQASHSAGLRDRMLPTRRHQARESRLAAPDFARRLDAQRINEVLTKLGWTAAGLYERAVY